MPKLAVIKTCAQLIELHNSQLPRTGEELEALPGVGRKTANVVLNTAFGEPTMAVDTHLPIFPTVQKFASGKNVLEVEKKQFFGSSPTNLFATPITG